MESPAEPVYEVVWPRSPQGVQRKQLAPRLPDMNGATIALLWDYLFRGDELFPLLEKELVNRFPDVTVLGYETWGNLHGHDEKERVGRLPDDLRNRGVDAVVSGMGC